MLIAGAVQQTQAPPQRGRYGGAAAWSSAAQEEPETINQASAIADYDYNIYDDEEVKYEMVSHTCAMSVKNARMAADMTQTQLAKKINEKPTVITDLENGNARYNADLINRIERAVGTKIDRGRKKKGARR